MRKEPPYPSSKRDKGGIREADADSEVLDRRFVPLLLVWPQHLVLECFFLAWWAFLLASCLGTGPGVGSWLFNGWPMVSSMVDVLGEWPLPQFVSLDIIILLEGAPKSTTQVAPWTGPVGPFPNDFPRRS